ncbi:MAG: hypothetical protein H0U75_09090 [Legionella sp.]|nr:hypothetical protein [Legionella sp.]
MPKEIERILSYTLATVLEPSDLEKVTGGSSVKTVGTQRFVGTVGGDTTIVFDNFDGI